MRKLLLSLATLVLANSLPAFADAPPPPGSPDPSNVGPPAGAILDLAGTPIPTSGYTHYTVNFTAAFSNTDLTFAFRNDPGYTAMDDVSLTNLTTSSAVPLVNPGFESGLTGWTYDNVYGATFGGSVSNGCHGLANHSGSGVWCDGATQAYDAIDQIVGTIIGDQYQIGFYLDTVDLNGTYPSSGLFQQLSTNSCTSTSQSCNGTLGNGVDVLVYEGSTIPAATPEPSSLLMLGTGLLGLGGIVRSRFAKA